MTTNQLTGQSDLTDPLARALLKQAMENQPMYSPLHALGKLAQFGVGSWIEQDRRDEDSKAETDYLKSMLGPNAAPRPAVPAGPSPTVTETALGPNASTTAPSAPGETWHTRQNNPGNMRATPESLKAYPGAKPGQNGFLAFDTPEQGTAAIAQTFRYIAKTTGENTLAGIISRYAPKGDGKNDPAAYAAAVGKETGIDPNAPLDVNDPVVMARIIPAVIKVETGVAPPSRFALPGQVAQAPGAVQTAQAPSPTATDLTRQPNAIPPDVEARIRRGLESKNPRVKAMAAQELQTYASPDKPTDEQREYGLYVRQEQAAGRQPMSFFGYKEALKKAGASPITNTVTMPGQAAPPTIFQQAREKEAVKRFEEAGDLHDKGIEAKRTIATLRGTLAEMERQGFKTGPGSVTENAIAQWLNRYGVSAKVLGLPENTAPFEVFQQWVTKLSLENVPKGQGQVSNYERELYGLAQPGAARSPQAIARMLDLMDKVASLNIIKKRMMDQYVNDPNGGAGSLYPPGRLSFDQHWGKYLEKRGLLAPPEDDESSLGTPATRRESPRVPEPDKAPAAPKGSGTTPGGIKFRVVQ